MNVHQLTDCIILESDVLIQTLKEQKDPVPDNVNKLKDYLLMLEEICDGYRSVNDTETVCTDCKSVLDRYKESQKRLYSIVAENNDRLAKFQYTKEMNPNHISREFCEYYSACDNVLRIVCTKMPQNAWSREQVEFDEYINRLSTLCEDERNGTKNALKLFISVKSDIELYENAFASVRDIAIDLLSKYENSPVNPTYEDDNFKDCLLFADILQKIGEGNSDSIELVDNFSESFSDTVIRGLIRGKYYFQS